MARGQHLLKKKETSQELYDLIGKEKVSRSGAIKLIWEYINENGLKEEGGPINCDAKLKAVYGKNKLKNTEIMGKILSTHLFDE